MPLIDHRGAVVDCTDYREVTVDWILNDLEDSPQHLALRFDSMSDGRPFSAAAILRQAGFTQQLIALGPVGLDRVSLGFQCGFTLVEITEAEQALLLPLHLSPFPGRYQPGVHYGAG